jgi:tetratricopeptide (TPR) repeat protein
MNRQERRRQKKLQERRGGGGPLKDDAAQNTFQQAMGVHQQGDVAGALALYRSILDSNPQHADTLALAGMACCQIDDLDGGIDYLQQSVAIAPNNLDAQFNLGQAFEAMERFEDAIKPYLKVAELEPGNVDVHFHLGTVYHSLEQDEEAAQHLRQVIAAMPDHADALSNLGAALKGLDEFDEAEQVLRKALALKKNDGVTLSNLGTVLKELNRLDEASEIHQRAVTLLPDYAEGHGNFGNTLAQQGLLEKAIEHFERALTLNPDIIEIRSNYCFALLKSGRFKKGWQAYSTRWQWKGFDHPTRPFETPHWQGEPLQGKTILVWGEQGIGDELMFASMFSDLVGQADTVIVETDPRLVPLFQRSFPTMTTVARDNPPDPTLLDKKIDFQIPSGELGKYLRADRSDFPKQAGYIKADDHDTKRLRETYKKLGNDAAVIGVSWRSGNEVVGEKRSAALQLWGPILATSGCFFVNLQYGNVKPFLDEFKKETDIEVYCDDDVDPLKNMDLFSAQIAAMDLVISIDNSTVHSAGSLGVPVWTLLAAAPDWRWGQDQDSSYWYPSMKLFRQETLGEWSSVFDATEVALENLVNQAN